MPTYEYECGSCGQVFDLFQSITARPLRSAKCERCGRTRRVKRLISGGAGLLFKGSGFYKTDYRSAGYQKSARSESDASGAPAPEKTDAQSTTAPAEPASKPAAPAKTESKPARDKKG